MRNERTNEPSDVPRCQECGAPLRGELACEAQFHVVLAWEADDAELLAEHFLTVACYNLQHPTRFTDDALVGLSAMLRRRLDEGLSNEKLRRIARFEVADAPRVLRRPDERPPVVPRDWPLTIADVYVDGQPQGAADRVRRWARTVREELDRTERPERPAR